MKFASIVPTKLLMTSKGQKSSPAALGYHLVLAPQILREPFYRDYYCRLHQQGHYIILDNGAAEEGTVSYSELQMAAEEVGADEVVIPDVLGDADRTSRLCEEFPYYDFRHAHLAFVPQGRTPDEWMECAIGNLSLAQMNGGGIHTVMFPKHTESFLGGRPALLHRFWGRVKYLYHVHMLGFYANPVKEIRELRKVDPHNRIRGVDSGAPVAYAQYNINLYRADVATLKHVSLEWDQLAPWDLIDENTEAILEECNPW